MYIMPCGPGLMRGQWSSLHRKNLLEIKVENQSLMLSNKKNSAAVKKKKLIFAI